MTEPARETLFVTDAELIRRLGVPEKHARQIVGQPDFPPKQRLWGDRRYWPAVKVWLANRPDTSEAVEIPSTAENIGCVYFLASQTHVKIGFSTRLKGRLLDHRVSNYEVMELLGTLDGVPKRIEAALHEKFARYRIGPRREWFTRSPEIEQFVRELPVFNWREME